MQVRSLDREDPLETRMATHSSILAWRIPWTEEPGGQQSLASQRVRRDWNNSRHTQPHRAELVCAPTVSSSSVCVWSVAGQVCGWASGGHTVVLSQIKDLHWFLKAWPSQSCSLWLYLSWVSLQNPPLSFSTLFQLLLPEKSDWYTSSSAKHSYKHDNLNKSSVVLLLTFNQQIAHLH